MPDGAPLVLTSTPAGARTARVGRVRAAGRRLVRNEEPTLSDALAAVRRSLWAEAARFPTARRAGDRVEVPRALLDRPTDLACHAA